MLYVQFGRLTLLFTLAALFFVPSARAGNCPGILGAVNRALSDFQYASVEEARRQLPRDEAAWTRHVQAQREALLARVAVADTPEKLQRAIAALDSLDQKLAAVGKSRIDAAIGATARNENVVVIALPEEPTAYQLLAMTWDPTTPKSIHIKGKTADSGIAQGFVPVDQSLGKAAARPGGLARYQQEVDQCLRKGDALAVPLKRGSQVAVIRDGEQWWVSVVQTGDKVVEILADSRGRPFVSDVDLLAIAPHESRPGPNIQNPRIVENYGDITSDDYKVVRKINQQFQKLDGPTLGGSHQRRSIVQHGAGNRYAGSSKLMPENFPMTVYRPDGRIERVHTEDALKSLFATLRSEGYEPEVNPAWGW